MDKTLIDPILAETYTKPQLIRRVRILQEFINYILFDYQGQKTVIATKMYIEGFLALHKDDLLKDDAFVRESSWLESLDNNFWAQFNISNVNNLFKEIESYISGLRTVTFYLPIEFPDTQISSIGGWLKRNVSPSTIFEISYDPNLIGGCAISFKGLYKDYSLKGRINDNKEAILQSLRDFKR